jgi:hypothetical protein
MSAGLTWRLCSCLTSVLATMWAGWASAGVSRASGALPILLAIQVCYTLKMGLLFEVMGSCFFVLRIAGPDCVTAQAGMLQLPVFHMHVHAYLHAQEAELE